MRVEFQIRARTIRRTLCTYRFTCTELIEWRQHVKFLNTWQQNDNNLFRHHLFFLCVCMFYPNRNNTHNQWSLMHSCNFANCIWKRISRTRCAALKKKNNQMTRKNPVFGLFFFYLSLSCACQSEWQYIVPYLVTLPSTISNTAPIKKQHYKNATL